MAAVISCRRLHVVLSELSINQSINVTSVAMKFIENSCQLSCLICSGNVARKPLTAQLS
jgi:hypothetical protein